MLLEGCHTVPAGSLRVIGKTDPVPFITVFATDELPAELRDQVRRELLEAHRFATLLKMLESKDGFKPCDSAAAKQDLQSGWQDFRGPLRQGLVPSLPHSLDTMQTAWTARLEDKGLGGVAATERWVLVTDRDRATGSRQIEAIRCPDRYTGTDRVADQAFARAAGTEARLRRIRACYAAGPRRSRVSARCLRRALRLSLAAGG